MFSEGFAVAHVPARSGCAYQGDHAANRQITWARAQGGPRRAQRHIPQPDEFAGTIPGTARDSMGRGQPQRRGTLAGREGERLHRQSPCRQPMGYQTAEREGTATRDNRPGKTPSARSIARMMTTERDTLSKGAALTVAMIGDAVPGLTAAPDLLDRFHRIVRHRKDKRLDEWLADAKTGLMSSFASGIGQDCAAVRAALTEPWSNGQTEGQLARRTLRNREISSYLPWRPSAMNCFRFFNGRVSVNDYSIAVGTSITGCPPHRTVRAGFPHTAPTLGV